MVEVVVGVGSKAALLNPPSKGGRARLHKAMHLAFRRTDTSLEVCIRGGNWEVTADLHPAPP
jgi:hypothetical protein